MTISPVLLALLGLALSMISGLLAGGIAWGRFSGALETLRADHAALRGDLKEAIATLSGVAVLRDRVDTLNEEVRSLRQARHEQAAQIARLIEQAESRRHAPSH